MNPMTTIPMIATPQAAISARLNIHISLAHPRMFAGRVARVVPLPRVQDAASLASLPGRYLLQLGEVLVNERDRHAALAHGRGDALDRAVTHITGGEDAGRARLEQIRIALQR